MAQWISFLPPNPDDPGSMAFIAKFFSKDNACMLGLDIQKSTKVFACVVYL